MDKEELYEVYRQILEAELKSALGCTEPIAIAYASAVAASALKSDIARVVVTCSGNIIKNVKGVTVPNSGGMKGIEVAALLGAIGGDGTKALEVLSSITKEDIAKCKELLKENICSVHLAEGVPGLYIKVLIFDMDGNSGEALVNDCHNEISELKVNGRSLPCIIKSTSSGKSDIADLKSYLDMEHIIDFANEYDISNLAPTFSRQLEYNSAIAEEGLKNSYGASIGKTIKKYYPWSDVRVRARAKAAAASDARMAGSALPVVINSGSGNQGITVSLPVAEYAKELGVSSEKLYRALAVSNLTAIHQKRFIGPLSAYCGAVSAAAGAAAGITYLHGGSKSEIASAVTNTLATVAGIVCDGAKASCAAKIASALEAALLSFEISFKEKRSFESGDGLVKESIDSTIKTFGKVGKDGMRETDIEILKLMLEREC